MKKKMIALLLVVMTTVTLLGCGETDSTTDTTTSTETTEEATTETTETEATTIEPVYLATFDVEQYITLGEYVGVEVTAETVNVTDEEVEYFIEYILSSSTETVEITDRAIESGDTANIDYVGKKDGVAFDGGTAAGYDLVIGSGSFIEGFEEGLIGVESGETVDLNLTFPEAYSSEDLAGQDVVFTVTVNAITVQQVPELTDDFVAGQGIEDCSTVADFEQYAYDMLYDEAVATQEATLEYDILAIVADNASYDELPEDLVQYYYEKINYNLEYEAAMYGVDVLELVYYFYGIADEDSYLQQLSESATSSAIQGMICQAIANVEGLNVTDEEVDAQCEIDYVTYGYESAEAYKEVVDMGEYKDYIMTEKVYAFLVENAVVIEVEATEEVTE